MIHASSSHPVRAASAGAFTLGALLALWLVAGGDERVASIMIGVASVLAALSTAQRSRRTTSRPSRWGWALLALGLACWGAAWLVSAADPPVGSRFSFAAVMLWQIFYLPAYAGMLTVLWKRTGDLHLARSLDALIVALSVASLGTLALDWVTDVVRHSESVVNPVYVSADLIVLAALCGPTGGAGRRRDPVWRAWLAAALMLLVGDVAWELDQAEGGSGFTKVGVGAYLAAVALLAFSTRLGPVSLPRVARRTGEVSVPVLGGSAALAVVAWDITFAVPLVSNALACLALLAVLQRLGLSYRETRLTMHAHVRASERQRLAVQQGASDGVWRLRRGVGLAEASPRLLEILGLDEQPGELGIDELRGVVHPEDILRLRAAVQAACAGPPMREEVRLLHNRTRTWRACVISGQAVGDAHGELQIVGTVHDITDRRRAEVQRAAIARDLHDSLAQDIAISAMYAQAAQSALTSGDLDDARETLTMLTDAIDDADQHMRMTLRTLRGEAISADAGGLHAAVRDAVAALRKRAPALDVQIRDQLPDGAHLEPHVLHAARNVLAEALNNAVKHACAQRVRVSITGDEENVTIEISDNGVGFDMDQASASGRYGLVGMRERAAESDARLSVHSQPGSGTLVSLTLPCVMTSRVTHDLSA